MGEKSRGDNKKLKKQITYSLAMYEPCNRVDTVVVENL